MRPRAKQANTQANKEVKLFKLIQTFAPSTLNLAVMAQYKQ